MPWQALADPTRRRILEVLAGGQRSAGEIAAHFSLTQAAISQHLKTLRQAGLVAVEPVAQQRIYRLDPHGLRELSHWIQALESFWRLDRLQAALKNESEDRICER